MLVLLVMDEPLSIVTGPCAKRVKPPGAFDAPVKFAMLWVVSEAVLPATSVTLFNGVPILLIATVPDPPVLAFTPNVSVLIGAEFVPIDPVELVMVRLLDSINC